MKVLKKHSLEAAALLPKRRRSLLGGYLLSSGLGLTSGVESESAVTVTHLLNEILGVKVSEHFSSNSSINLELVAENGNSDI